MKKSTLITTIAMIVVVVVALSTATYAWFTSATTNKVTATVTTEGAGDYSISVALLGSPNASTGANTISSWSGASSAVTINNDLMSGLFAPVAELNYTNTQLTSAAAIAGTGKFYDAESLDNNTTATLKHSAEYYVPSVLRIQNTSGEVRTLTVSIDINVGTGSNSADIFAGESVAFALICQDKSFNSITTLTSGYSYGGSLSAGGAASYDVGEIISSPTSVTTSTGYTRMDYDGLTSSVGTVLADDDSERGANQGDYVNTQTLTISPSLPNADYVYVTIYLWIDGWRADNSAAGASDLSINFRFGGAAVV